MRYTNRRILYFILIYFTGVLKLSWNTDTWRWKCVRSRPCKHLSYAAWLIY